MHGTERLAFAHGSQVTPSLHSASPTRLISCDHSYDAMRLSSEGHVVPWSRIICIIKLRASPLRPLRHLWTHLFLPPSAALHFTLTTMLGRPRPCTASAKRLHVLEARILHEWLTLLDGWGMMRKTGSGVHACCRRAEQHVLLCAVVWCGPSLICLITNQAHSGRMMNWIRLPAPAGLCYLVWLTTLTPMPCCVR